MSAGATGGGDSASPPELKFTAIMDSYVGPGWVPIVNGLYDELIKIDPDIRIHQVKEKFGGLRFHFGSSDPSPSVKVALDRLVEDAERKCWKTCENCGSTTDVSTKPGSWQWVKTLCDFCRLTA